MYLKKLSLREKIIEGILFSLLFFDSCTDRNEPGEYIARVNNSYLTKSDLSEIADTVSITAAERSELINIWIRKEVLYQEAVNEGIIDDEKFEKLIENSRKELAGALLLQKYSYGKEITFSEPELEKYYNTNRNSFTLPLNAFYLNRISFRNHESAVQFRTDAISKGWEKAAEDYVNDTSLAFSMNNLLVNDNSIYPTSVLRIVKGLYPPEISIVISDDAGYYTVIQVLNMFNKDSVPPFEVIKNEVEKRYLAERKKAAVEKYIEELYEKDEIEINN